VVDFIVRSIRFTSGCWTMGEVFAPLHADGLALQALARPGERALVGRSAIATPSSPTDRRAAFIMMNMYSRPRCGSPTR
jgi:hypothetical protein